MSTTISSTEGNTSQSSANPNSGDTHERESLLTVQPQNRGMRLIIRRPLTLRRRIRQRPPIEVTKWYHPDSRLIFKAAAKLEDTVYKLVGPSKPTAPAWTLISRIYYAIIIRIAILVIRQETNVASAEELTSLSLINAAHVVKTLPVASSIGQVMIDALPFYQNEVENYAILPAQAEFSEFHTTFDDDETLQLDKVVIPTTSTILPDPAVIARVLKWLRYHNTDEPANINATYQQKLHFLGTGHFRATDDIIDAQVSSPAGPLESVLADPGLYEEPLFDRRILLRAIMQLSPELVPPTISRRIHQHPSPQCGHEYIVKLVQSQWFSVAKGVISTQATLGDELSTLEETIIPCSREQIDEGSLIYEPPSPLENVEQSYLRSRYWM